jgi:Protein of unknown function (DUF3011)
MQKSAITVAALAVSLPLMAQQTITCSSTNGASRFCPANTKNGVMLVQEHSNNVCEQGSTWTYTTRGISVNGGCSADFRVGGSTGNNNNGNNGYGSKSYGGRNGNNENGEAYPNNNNQNTYPDNNRDAQNTYDNNGDGNRQQTALVIPTGTRLDVRLEQTVSPANVNQGDSIPATLVNDVSVNGRLIAPAGTPIQAKVVSAQGAPLDVRLDSMTIHGQDYKLVTSSVHSAKDGQAAQNGNNQTAGQQIGSVLGTLTGGAQLPSGSVYTFRLTSPARPRPLNR